MDHALSFKLTANSSADILPTTRVDIGRIGRASVKCRAVLDTASTRNFITESLVSRLQLPKERCSVPVESLNNTTTMTQFQVEATIGSRFNEYRRTLKFLVVPSITNRTPDVQITRDSLGIPKDLFMADPDFFKPCGVDLLICSGTSFASLCVGQIKLSSASDPDLILQKTQFGWVLSGNVPSHLKIVTKGKCHLNNTGDDISRFWEMEEIGSSKHLSEEEAACEKHFVDNIRRDSTGRFVAALPFRGNTDLGATYLMAMRRFLSLERRFQRNEEFRDQYRRAIREYIDLGYAEKTTEKHAEGYFIPHQAVFKHTSLTTKTRIVFDASAKSSSGISLNEALLAGPTIQDDIFSLLLRFRVHRYVLTGDIEKMYLQVKIRDEDHKYLKFLWRNESGEISSYQFNRLIFGLKPASFIATRCLHRLAEEESTRFPAAAEIIKRDLYVDDLLTGADSVEDLVRLHGDLSRLLHEGGFNLRQCASNHKDALQAIPDRCVNLQLQDAEGATLKTLGVYWNSANDRITYTVKPKTDGKITKRSIFSEVARIYDPLGLLNPAVVTAKLLIQELWRLKIDWDESLPVEIHTRWKHFTTELTRLNDMSFDRRVVLHDSKTVELHGFCDASEKAFGACVYMRSTNEHGNSATRLLCAKSRVAPVKTPQTIPRLELCAAVLLSELYTNVVAALPMQAQQTIFWTDSMIALHWVNMSPHRLQTFVANRVSRIRSLTNPEDWRHVRTHDNPADLLSRGVAPEELVDKELWLKGPCWLAGGEALWPARPVLGKEQVTELRPTTCLVSIGADPHFLHRFSSYTKLLRVVAWCRRFLPGTHSKGPPSVHELHVASTSILKTIQHAVFYAEYDDLSKRRPVSTKSRLKLLNPFVDNEGLIRVGGRLENANLPYQRKHPIVLPKSHHITRLIIEAKHLETLHGGVQATLSAVRQQFWPIDGRNQTRRVVRACVRCVRAAPPCVDYLMGDLPKDRTVSTRPFTNAGVDYCGPFFIKEKKNRNRGKVKAYVAVFVCLSTKAVHLELVSDLTTETFIAALKRFIARRGKCATIASDNATNFVGTNNELRELHELLISKEFHDKVDKYMTDKGIVWKFIPPRAPHCGGLWEAAVKSFKRHLRRVVGNELFTFEQLNTLVIEIEAVLNSRPLTPLSSDPNDLTPLTPSHFLIGDTMMGLPEADFSAERTNRLSTWQHIQKVKRDFWSRWQKEYVHELNIRRKWVKGDHSLRPGSMVLLRDDNSPPMQWRMGKITEVLPGRDGIVRTARIRTANGEVLRNIKGVAQLLDDDIQHQPKKP